MQCCYNTDWAFNKSNGPHNHNLEKLFGYVQWLVTDVEQFQPISILSGDCKRYSGKCRQLLAGEAKYCVRCSCYFVHPLYSGMK